MHDLNSHSAPPPSAPAAAPRTLSRRVKRITVEIQRHIYTVSLDPMARTLSLRRKRSRELLSVPLARILEWTLEYLRPRIMEAKARTAGLERKGGNP